jgi:hypothetical protein
MAAYDDIVMPRYHEWAVGGRPEEVLYGGYFFADVFMLAGLLLANKWARRFRIS